MNDEIIIYKDHHIECSCSFCKPVDNQLKQDLEDYNDWQ